MRRIIYFVILLSIACACKNTVKETQDTIAKMSGKEVVFPEGMTYQIGDREIDYNPSDGDYKIIVYIDSSGCTTCRMKIPVWEQIISEYKHLTDKEINFLMVLNTAPTPEFIYVIKQKDFKHPICFDPENKFGSANNFPTQDEFHTMLLDAEDKIIALGNPADNPKIKKLYDRIIGLDSHQSPSMCQSNSRSLGTIKNGRVKRINFRLKNPTDSLLTIEDIIPSCDCSKVYSNTDSLLPHKNLTIFVEYLPDSTETGPFHKYVDVFFNERTSPERLTYHGYLIN